MKKINITVICAGDEDYPGCVDLLAAYPEINIVARPTGLNEAGTRGALARSDVLLLDEAALDEDGHHAVRAIHDSYPLLRSLLILEDESQQEMMAVLSLGILGVIRRDSIISQLCKKTGDTRSLEDMPVSSDRMKLH
jgi:DNA-binding NarL/FixJ family response regulator